MPQSIALIGRARSGKDSVAAHLTAHYDYHRVAFADPLREIARRTDPIVDVSSRWAPRGMDDVLSMETESYIKVAYPEYRRFLQNLGESVRHVLGENTWLDAALTKVHDSRTAGHPVVVTDVRYLNEADALRARGFTMVRVVRPNSVLSLAGQQHISETALDGYPVGETLHNTGTLKELHTQVDALIK